MAGEMLAPRLNTIHNLFYYVDLMRQMRQAIGDGKFDEFKKKFHGQRQALPFED